MPFVWNTIVQKWTMPGNRQQGSNVNLRNGMWFSYPSYNEILTGQADDERITRNDKIYNPNKTILEELNNSNEYKGSVAAFASWDVFPYMFTHNYALEYMMREQPDMVYIAYGETDDFAHNGNYQAYLNSAHSTDDFFKELWNFTQQNSYHGDKTTFIVTTDHGRGTQPVDDWRNHGSDVKGAGEVWLMMYGNGIERKGEVMNNEQLYITKVVDVIEAVVK